LSPHPTPETPVFLLLLHPIYRRFSCADHQALICLPGSVLDIRKFSLRSLGVLWQEIVDFIPILLGANKNMRCGTPRCCIKGAKPQPENARHTIAFANYWRTTNGAKHAVNALWGAERFYFFVTAYDIE
jgi:hypothetical protein